MKKHASILLIGEWGSTLGLCFLLLWGGPWAPLAASGFPLAHVHSMGLHAGLALGCLVGAYIRALQVLPRTSVALICGATGVTGFAVPAFFERLDNELFAAAITTAGAMLTGFALALLLYCCVRDLSSVAERQRPLVFLAGAAAALGVFAALLYGADSDALLLVACFGLLPLSLIFVCLPAGRAPFGNVPDDELAMVGAPAACVFLLGLESVVLMQLGFVVQVHQVGIALLAGLVLVAIWMVLRRPVTVVEAYFVAFPLVATCLLAFPFVGGFAQGAVIFVSNAIVLVVLALILVGSPDSSGATASQSRRSMLLLGVFHISVLVGFGLGALFRDLFDGDLIWGLAAVFVCLYALSACAFVLLWRRRSGDGKADVAHEKTVVDAMVDQCALARECFGLSDRETEVLELAMRGRDVPTMAKLLFISPNTVRFHMKNLYQAMGVHGKQEMIDVVEHLK